MPFLSFNILTEGTNISLSCLSWPHGNQLRWLLSCFYLSVDHALDTLLSLLKVHVPSATM